MRLMRLTGRRAVGEVDSVYAWLRLLAGVLISTIGGVGMWSIAVVLPTLQADFGVTRADVSLAYTAVMLGAVVGGPLMGWLSDRFGITLPVAIGTAMLALGLALASQAATMWQFTLVHGLLIGGGTSASFGPVIADISLWFAKRRGVAVAICSSGSYLAGTVWPLVIQPLAQRVGWRHTYFGIAVFCLCSMLPLLRALRQRRAIVADAGGRGLLHCDGDAASPHRCLLHRSWLRRRARRGDAVADVRNRHYQPALLRLDRRPHRPGPGAAHQFVAAGRLAAGLFRRQRADLPLRRYRDVRPRPGRYRADLRADRARMLSPIRSRRSGRLGVVVDAGRDGDRRLDVGCDLRRDAVVSRRFPQRLCLEFVEHGDRGLVVAAATPAQDGKVRVKSIHCRACRVVSPTIGLRRSGSTIRRRLVFWLSVAAWRRAPSFATGDANFITSRRFNDLI